MSSGPSNSHGEPSRAPDRAQLRAELLARRTERGDDPDTEARIAAHLGPLLDLLEPTVLGVYWPVRFEFNPVRLLGRAREASTLPLALPWVQKTPREMHFRHWNRATPALRDEVGIPASDGAPVVPDVVLAPCVGYSAAGYRLGYGGGYFDRFLAAHPHVTAIGIAPAWAAVDFAAEAHDVALPLIVTEEGVRGG